MQDNETHVWLVEDNAAFRKTVARALDRLDGMTCSANFESFEEAFEALENRDAPDVVLLDVQLPGIDGISALGQLRVPGGRSVSARPGVLPGRLRRHRAWNLQPCGHRELPQPQQLAVPCRRHVLHGP